MMPEPRVRRSPGAWMGVAKKFKRKPKTWNKGILGNLLHVKWPGRPQRGLTELSPSSSNFLNFKPLIFQNPCEIPYTMHQKHFPGGGASSKAKVHLCRQKSWHRVAHPTHAPSEVTPPSNIPWKKHWGTVKNQTGRLGR